MEGDDSDGVVGVYSSLVKCRHYYVYVYVMRCFSVTVL
jgi:hypothetical protein